MAGLEDFLESIKCLGGCYLLFNSLWGTLNSIIIFFFPVCIMVGLLLGWGLPAQVGSGAGEAGASGVSGDLVVCQGSLRGFGSA